MMKLKMKSCVWVNPHPPPHLPPIQLSAKRVLKQFGYDKSLFCIPAVRGLSKTGESGRRSKVFCGQMDQERGIIN